MLTIRNRNPNIVKLKIIASVLIFILTVDLIYQKFNVEVTLSVKSIEEIRKSKISEAIVESSETWIVTRSFDEVNELQADRNANMLALIVNDDRTILTKRANGMYEEIDESEQLGNEETINSDPKNQAYLFAIKNEAELIYDCEDYPNYIDLASYFIYDMNDYGLIYDYSVGSRRVINSLAHFGQPLLTQRGNPFGSEVHINSYFVGKRRTSAVQHAILEQAQDLMNTPESSSVEFDKTAPNFQLPIGKMGVFNSRSTLFRYQAFWALYLPKTAPLGYSDIWRSFWSQRLMWLIDETVTFIGPNSDAVDLNYQSNSRRNNNLLDDDRIKHLIEFLYKWRCQKVVFYDCIMDLSYDMANNGFWEIEEVSLIENWLNILLRIGYKLPKMVNFNTNSTIIQHVYNDPKMYSKVRFTPKIQSLYGGEKQFRNGSVKEALNKLETYLYLNDFCQLSNYTIGNLSQFISKPYKYRANYTLLVTFNLRVFEKNIPILVHLLDSYFQNIVFCGAKIIDVLNESRGVDRERFDSYTFVEYDSLNGYFHYYCMNKAIEMNYNTEGILLASDDVLIKPWNMRNLDATKIWYFEALKPKLELKLKIENFTWMWWPGNAPLLIKLFNYTSDVISGRTADSTPKEVNFTREFISNLDRHRINNFYISFGGSDIFYLPKRKFEIFRYISSVFQRHEIFLEIAVPTILNGIDGERDAVVMNGVYCWGSTFTIDQYDKAETFAHPFKMSGLRGSENGAKYCKLHIQQKIDRNI